MLDFQVVQAPFRFGVEEGIDPKQVPFGTLLTAKDVVWKKSGRLEKRYGTQILSSSIVGGGSLSAASRLVVRGDELALTDGSTLYGYTSSGWVSRGRLPNVGLEWSTHLDTSQGIATSDLAVLSNGQVVEIWVTGNPARLTAGSLYYQIRDVDSGSAITAPTLLAATTVWPLVRIVSTGTTWLALWVDGSGNLKYGNASGTGTLKTDAAFGANARSLDAVVFGTDFVVAYSLNAGGIRLVRYSLASTPVQVSTATVTGEASTNIGSISVAGGDGEKLYIAYSVTTTGIKFAISNPSTMAQTVAPTSVVASASLIMGTVAAVRSSSTSCLLVYSFATNTYAAGFTASATISSTGTVTAGRFTYYMRVLTRPVLIGSRFYSVFATDYLALRTEASLAFKTSDVVESDSFLVDVTNDGTSSEPFREVGKVDVTIAGGWTRGFVSTPSAISSTETAIAVGYQAAVSTDAIGVRQGVRFVRATTGASLPEDLWRSVSQGGEAYLAGPVFTSYDGIDPIGYGWPHAPYIDPINTVASAAGGVLATGNYIYNVTGERRSNVGVLHRSPAGIATTVAVTGPTGSVTVGVIAASLGHSSNIPGGFPLFRSVVDGTIVQRIAVEPSFMTFVDSGLSFPATTVDVSGDTNIYPNTIGTDGFALATRAAIYTAGGELDDHQPPAFVTVALYRDRLFGIAGDRREVWFSKDYKTNPGVAPGFNPALRIVFNDTLTALAVLDERLIVFSETGIYYLAGDGPAPNGDGGYDSPNKLQTDVGCTNARGVVSTADGVYFVNNSEIHLLTRGMEIAWVGKPMQDKLTSYPNITSAVCVTAKNQIRFTCNATDGLSGVVLVFDYVEKQWSHFEYSGGVAIADACMHGGVYTFVTTSGAVYKEDSTTYLDNGSFVAPMLETAWVHAAGPLSYHSVRNFRIDGVSATPHGLAISVGFDGESTYQQGPTTWAESVSGVTSIADNVTANVSIGTRRKCRSIRFKIVETAPAMLGTGQGAKWSSMGIEVGVKRGLGALAARQKG
jgi:hypothetical protein